MKPEFNTYLEGLKAVHQLIEKMDEQELNKDRADVLYDVQLGIKQLIKDYCLNKGPNNVRE